MFIQVVLSCKYIGGSEMQNQLWSKRQNLFALMMAVLFVVPLSAQAASNELPSLAPMLEDVIPAVVNISTTRGSASPERLRSFNERDLRRFFEEGLIPPGPAERPVRSAGSGVIVDAAKGYIITNHHVVVGSDTISVVLTDDRRFEAKLLGSDPSTDVALLQIEAEGLVALEFADVSNLRVGDYVVAIGNPFGIGQTVTYGIVSALGRAGLNVENYEDFIQTDAAINMGNSGGALVNLAGELVGINTAIISGTGANLGVGFAVPVNMVAAVSEQLQQHGEVRRGQLGVQIRDHTPALEEMLDAGADRGALVVGVMEGSAADRAGIEVSDVIVEVNGRNISSSRELRNIVGLAQIDSAVDMVIYRDGERRQISAVIGNGGDSGVAQSRNGSVPDGRRLDDPVFRGAQLQSHSSGGVGVVNVAPQSPAWAAGLRPGDVIHEVNRQSVNDLRGFNQEVSKSDNVTALGIVRDERPLLIIMS